MSQPGRPHRWARKSHPAYYESRELGRGCVTADGMHDPLTDKNGCCLFCGKKIDKKQPEYVDPRDDPQMYLSQDPLADEPDEARYYDG